MSEFDQCRPFLDEVLANPDDDAPRLIFADYLEELGDPRGEFIRLQCELAVLDELDPRYLDLSHRCDELLLDHQDAWASELKQDVRKTEFSRGFIDNLTIRARAFVKEADALFKSTPVNWLRFNYVKGVGQQLAATAALSNVRSLDLGGLKIPENDLNALLMSPHLVNLQSLNLVNYDGSMSASVGATLHAMPAAKMLRHLEVPGDPTFLHLMASGDGFPKLEHLTIGPYYPNDLGGLAKLKVPNLSSLKIRGSLNVADTEAVAGLPVAQLKQLDLSSTNVPGRGLQVLAERGAFDSVVDLSLAVCGLGSRGVAALFHADRLQHCKSLNLAHNPKKPRQLVQRLAEHKGFRQLKRLHLSGLTPSDFRWIADAEPFHQLELLALDGVQFGPDDVVAFAASPISKSLRHLKLIGCEIDATTIKGVTKTAMFPNLLRLDLGGGYDDISALDETMVIELITSSAFPNLQAIKLDYLYLSSKTFAAMAANANLPELRQISYCHNRASRKSIDAVMNSPRLAKLSQMDLTGTSGLGNRENLIAAYGGRVQC